ncbi:MAG: response regulator [Proteobacteria bacterium]|nr:response regulator [Pseudomonadota bacterium]
MKKTILVVEDDGSRRKAMVDALTSAGYDVIAGEDFAAALNMVDRLGVDVMISDLQLSAANPGGQALTRLAQRWAVPPKLLYVSRAPVPNGQGGPRPDDILPLPLDRAQLLDKVRLLLAS